MEEKNIGQRLFQARKSKGLTLAEMSIILNISVGHVQKIEKNERIPSKMLLVAIEEYLNKSDNPNNATNVTLVPVWDSVPAGWPAEKGIVCEEPIDYIPVNGSGKNMGALLVEGHSMSPEIREGEYVLYTQDYDIKPGDWIVAMDEFNRPMIKEYALKQGESWLVSINPEYPSFKVNCNYRIIGKVIDIYSRRKAKRRTG